MLFYLIENEAGKYEVVRDDVYSKDWVKLIDAKLNDRVKNKFGRDEYAQIWKDFYNGDIDQKGLRKRLYPDEEHS